MRTVILISNKLYHYRISIYNYFAARFREHGYELVVISCGRDPQNPYPINFTLHVEPFAFAKYYKIIAGYHPAAVVLFLHMKDLIVWPLMVWLRLKRIHSIYWNHGINLQTPDDRAKNFLFHILHSLANVILLYSAQETRFIRPSNRTKVMVAPNTLNFADIPDISESANELKQKHGIPYQRVVLFVGRVTQEKRLEDLVSCCRYLSKGIGVVVAGGGMDDALKQKTAGQTMVTNLGPVYNPRSVNELFKLSDVFSIPGKCGLGINHAFYWGLPVVTQKVLHSPEIIYLRDGHNGFMVQPGDHRALAAKINLLCGSQEMLRRFGAHAKETIQSEAGIDRMFEGFLAAVRTGHRV